MPASNNPFVHSEEAWSKALVVFKSEQETQRLAAPSGQPARGHHHYEVFSAQLIQRMAPGGNKRVVLTKEAVAKAAEELTVPSPGETKAAALLAKQVAFALESPASSVKNLGPSKAGKLAKLGVLTVRDLLTLNAAELSDADKEQLSGVGLSALQAQANLQRPRSCCRRRRTTYSRSRQREAVPAAPAANLSLASVFPCALFRQIWHALLIMFAIIIKPTPLCSPTCGTTMQLGEAVKTIFPASSETVAGPKPSKNTKKRLMATLADFCSCRFARPSGSPECFLMPRAGASIALTWT